MSWWARNSACHVRQPSGIAKGAGTESMRPALGLHLFLPDYGRFRGRLISVRAARGGRACVRSGVCWARCWARYFRQIPASPEGKNGRSCAPPWVYRCSCRKYGYLGAEWGSGGRRFESGRPDLLCSNELRRRPVLNGLVDFRSRVHIGHVLWLHRGGFRRGVRRPARLTTSGCPTSRTRLEHGIELPSRLLRLDVRVA